MEQKIMDFNQSPVQLISLDTLRLTAKETDTCGNPLHGMYHFDVIDRVLEMFAGRELKYEITEIFACQNRSRRNPGVSANPELETRYGVGSPQSLFLRRVFVNLRITNYDLGGLSTGFSIAYTQSGIEFGMGSLVRVCRNQCMLHPDWYATTTMQLGTERSRLDTCLEKVRTWFEDMGHELNHERQLIKDMESRQVEKPKFLELLGKLVEARVRHDTPNKKIHSLVDYALNQNQINEFTENTMMLYDYKSPVSVWDIYNAATVIYKPGRVAADRILLQNTYMAQFLCNEFELV